MSSVTDAMKRLNDEELRKQYNREFWGTNIDDYMRNLAGKESYYNEQARLENERYWADYTKNTETIPRYPIKTGAQWNMAMGTLPLGLTQLPGKMKAIDKLYGGME